MIKNIFMTLSFGVSAILFAGCSNGSGVSETQAPSPATAAEPVTLHVQFIPANVDIFQTYVLDQMKKKFPNISMEFSTEGKLADKVAAGEAPDIYTANIKLKEVTDLGLQYDMSSLIKKHKFDLNKLDPSLTEGVRAFSEKRELYGLPSGRNTNVLMYNKDLFDRFAVPYPKDGMTWDDLLALTRKLTRNDGGVQYFGLHPGNYQLMRSELKLGFFNKDGKADVTTTGWQKLANMWRDVFQANGSEFKGGNARNIFTKDKNTAMIITNPSFLVRNPVADFNWDMVTAPTFDNRLIPDELGAMFCITSTSKNKDAAFQALSMYFDDAVMTNITRDAAIIVNTSNPEIQKQYGTNIKANVGKNLQAVFKGKAASKLVNEYDDIADPIMNNQLKKLTDGGTDVNTALREGQEAIDQKMRDAAAN